MTKLTSFTEFQPLALRTEAKIETVKTSQRLLVALLVANVATAELLDAIKKQVFYKNDKKLLEKTSQINADASSPLRLAMSAAQTRPAISAAMVEGE